ncbi:HupE/UreJ family protein [Pseudaminobacter sp. NGMCC 1.201702]|uniref:HupE/UreJ family protein n=1 Tax=Pseudaminobacter sp. NGMCC 1.201702 TaxID=3391825 RepID=UPI0039F09803
MTNSPYSRFLLVAGVCAALVPFSEAAFAHSEGHEISGFLSGLSHPIGGWDHILAMIAVGLWGALLGPPALWVLPIAFPIAMAAGGMLGLLGIPLPWVEIGIAVSSVVLGLLILKDMRLSLAIAIPLVMVFALFHGHAHGTELSPGADAVLYSLGFVIATGLLHALGIGIGAVDRLPKGRTAVRALGGGVLAGGVYFLLGAFA